MVSSASGASNTFIDWYDLWLQCFLEKINRGRWPTMYRQYYFFGENFYNIRDWKMSDLGWHFLSHCFSWGVCSNFWALVEKAGPRKAGSLQLCLGRGINCDLLRCLYASVWIICQEPGLLAASDWVWVIFLLFQLIKWFPDRRGLATGMAIMGFGVEQ